MDNDQRTPSGEIDEDFRPRSYWPEEPDPALLLARVSGDERRRIAEAKISVGEPVEERLLDPELPEEEREAWAAQHPRNMGGEYLPSLDDESVEIARLSIASTTGDVTSVRARQDGNLISLEIVDEYETEYSFEPTTSDRPLSLGELIDLIDSATHEDAVSTGLVKGIAMMWLDGVVDDAEIQDGIKMTSAFYPQLQAYYERRLDSWIAERRDR